MTKTIFKNKWIIAAALIILTSAGLNSCKKKFAEPPQWTDPGLTATMSLKDLKAKYTSGAPVQITDDIIVSGIVSCDDKSGNFYQQIAFQDTSGGLLLRLAGSSHFNNFPVGRKIYVKCKGLWLGQYNGTLQLGGSVDSAYINQGGVTLIPVNLQDKYVIRGPLNQPLVPKVVTVSQLTTSLQDRYVNTLVQLQGYEFNAGELGKNYADDAQSGNRILQDCSGSTANRITLRTSNYCNFATIRVAQGNGTINGVYSFFGSTKQFTIRDTSDVKFNGTRCPTASGSGSITLGNTSPFVINFDNLATSGIPSGVYVKQDATADYTGNEATVTSATFNSTSQIYTLGAVSWNTTSLGFKNYASATGLTSTTSTTLQSAATNRALGSRQTGTAGSGGDPGYAYAFQLANTTGKTNLKLTFKLQSLDAPATAGRTVTWKVDYAVGLSPAGFTTVTTSPATLTTANGTFSNTTVTVNFGSALNNINQPVWIRVVALTSSTGGGNRPSTAIDDVSFSWN